jgi:hypothetical protein
MPLVVAMVVALPCGRGSVSKLVQNSVHQPLHYFGGQSAILLGIRPLGHDAIYHAVNNAAAQFIQNLATRRCGRGTFEIRLKLALEIVNRFAGVGWSYGLRLRSPSAGVCRQPGLQIFNNRTRPGRRVDDCRRRFGRGLPG